MVPRNACHATLDGESIMPELSVIVRLHVFTHEKIVMSLAFLNL